MNNKFENWISKPHTINTIVNFGIVLLVSCFVIAYTMIGPNYDPKDILNWDTLLIAGMVNSAVLLVKYAINDWAISSFRSKNEYAKEVDTISNNKDIIEKNGYLKAFQEELDVLNLERKKRAYMNIIDIRLQNIDKKMLKAKTEDKLNKLKEEIEELNQLKFDTWNDNVDLNLIAVEYSRLNTAKIFAGANISSDKDTDIEDNAKKTYYKTNGKSTLFMIIGSILFAGVGVDAVARQDFMLMLLFLGSILVNIVISYSVTNYIERNSTLPKAIIRNGIMIEFLDKIHTKITDFDIHVPIIEIANQPHKDI